jgi:hypothetical protein
MSLTCIQFVSRGKWLLQNEYRRGRRNKKAVGREYCTIRTTLEAQMLKEDMMMMVAMAMMDDG